MLRILFFFITCILSLSHSFASVAEDDIDIRFHTTLDRIVILNREIQKSPSRAITEKLFRERDTLTRYSKSLYRHLHLRNILTPTLDLSKRYKLTLQKYALSCEIAALRMIVESITKRYITEDTIIRAIPHSPMIYSGGIWGDPDNEFVGSYLGTQRGRTGYGVHEAPLAKYLASRDIENRYENIYTQTGITTDARLSQIITAIHDGHHVLLWGDWCTDVRDEDGMIEKVDMYLLRVFPLSGRNTCSRAASERVFSWYTKEGKFVPALAGEHAFLLLGYVGARDAPTHIIVWDTDTGTHYYPTREWMRKWKLMDYRTLIAKEKSSPENK